MVIGLCGNEDDDKKTRIRGKFEGPIKVYIRFMGNMSLSRTRGGYATRWDDFSKAILDYYYIADALLLFIDRFSVEKYIFSVLRIAIDY